MQAQRPIDPRDEAHEDPAPEVSELRSTRALLDESPLPEAELGAGAAQPPQAGADLPEGADPDLLLQAIQKREQRAFALKFTAILGGLALAAYLAGSGNAAILQGVVHIAVGAAAGGAGALAFLRRSRTARA